MNEARFIKLIEAVEATPEAQFYMGAWAKKTACGTVGCAVGNYILRNPGRGLELKFSINGIRMSYATLTGTDDYAAAGKHFGITREQAMYLFYEAEYPDNATKSVVLARLLKFYEQHRKPSTAQVNADLDRLLADIEATPEQACMTGIHGFDDSYLDTDGQ